MRTITLPPIPSRTIAFGVPTSSLPSGVIVAALIPSPAALIAAADSCTTPLLRGAAILEREVEVLELNLEPEQVGVQDAQRLLEQLLAGFVAVQYDDFDCVGHPA